jgi:hypothetical protein
VLLNLDTEDWGEIFIGCAGGGDSMITLPVQHEAVSASGADVYSIAVTGARVSQKPEPPQSASCVFAEARLLAVSNPPSVLATPQAWSACTASEAAAYYRAVL